MTAREIYGYGLIAGIGVEEARHLEPGFVMDMFKMRGEYDRKLRGIKRAPRPTVNDL